VADESVYLANEEHGRTSRALCIPDPKLHQARLRLTWHMLQALQLASVLDVGCGFGDLRSGLMPGVTYTGIDVTEWIVATAKQENPHINIERHDALAYLSAAKANSFDAVVSLGMLSTVAKDDAPWLLREMKRVAARVVVVSWLDADEYRGHFNAWTHPDIEQPLGKFKALSSLMGDNECTGMFLA
jgi:2-polyprenyl-3-methyl-5-hydroxy-6-metoxy-1,4-benzoquinol methylase